jgi:integrase-like protein
MHHLDAQLVGPALQPNPQSLPWLLEGTRDQARLALFHWIESFYNSRRRHSTLGQRSPARYEEIMINNNPRTAVAVST